MKAGEDVLKTGTVIDARMTVVLRTGASRIGAQVMPMERTVGLLLTAALPIEDPRTDILRTDNRLIVGPPLIVALPRVVLQATVLPIVVQEIRVRATAGLPLIVAPQSTGLQIAR